MEIVALEEEGPSPKEIEEFLTGKLWREFLRWLWAGFKGSPMFPATSESTGMYLFLKNQT